MRESKRRTCVRTCRGRVDAALSGSSRRACTRIYDLIIRPVKALAGGGPSEMTFLVVLLLALYTLQASLEPVCATEEASHEPRDLPLPLVYDSFDPEGPVVPAPHDFLIANATPFQLMSAIRIQLPGRHAGPCS